MKDNFKKFNIFKSVLYVLGSTFFFLKFKKKLRKFDSFEFFFANYYNFFWLKKIWNITKNQLL